MKIQTTAELHLSRPEILHRMMRTGMAEMKMKKEQHEK
jgi:hypothetical protein